MPAEPGDQAPSTLDRALAAALPVDIIADPISSAGTAAVETRLQDAVRPERMRDGAFIVAGWGDDAWRSRARIIGEVVTVRAPKLAIREAQFQQWLEHAQRIMAETLPNAVDATTREALARNILAPPIRFAESQDRLLRLILGSHRTLRRCARRVLLQTVAESQLGLPTEPSRSPTWHFLARLTRTPAERLAGSTSEAVLTHDATPQCPTARRLRQL